MAATHAPAQDSADDPDDRVPWLNTPIVGSSGFPADVGRAPNPARGPTEGLPGPQARKPDRHALPGKDSNTRVRVYQEGIARIRQSVGAASCSSVARPRGEPAASAGAVTFR